MCIRVPLIYSCIFGIVTCTNGIDTPVLDKEMVPEINLHIWHCELCENPYVMETMPNVHDSTFYILLQIWHCNLQMVDNIDWMARATLYLSYSMKKLLFSK